MPRTCPHCRESIPVDEDFSFDENLNLICGRCGKIAFVAAPLDYSREQIISPTTTLLPQKWGVKELEPEDDGA